MNSQDLAHSAPKSSFNRSRLKGYQISVSFPGTYFLVLVVSLLFVAYQFAQSNAYYFSLCLLGVSLVSLGNLVYQVWRLGVRLPTSMLVAAEQPFRVPINVNRASAYAECAIQDGPFLALQSEPRDGRYHVVVAAQKRGLYHIDNIRLRLRCALGVFEISKAFHLDCSVYVYPAIESEGVDPGNDDVESLDLHPYRAGDSVHRIDWRGAARGRELHCYRSSEQQANDIYLRLEPRAALESELTRLSGLVLARSRGFGNFGLQLGQQRVDAGQGEAHVTHCLQQLAAYRAPQAARFAMAAAPDESSTEIRGGDESLSNKGLLLLCALTALSPYVSDPLGLPLAFCLAALLWRLLRAPLAPSWRNQIVLSLFVMGGAAFQCIKLSSVFSFYTAVSYLCLALASKLLFYRPQRDALATVSLFFLISCMAFYNSDHTLQVLSSLTCLFSGMLYVLSLQQKDISGYRISALLSAAIVIASTVYALLPAPEQPLWQLSLARQNTSVGLADEVRPGSMSSLSRNHQVIFRAYLSPQLSRISDFFWRASVFDEFDGRSWRRGDAAAFTWVAGSDNKVGPLAPMDFRYRVEFVAQQDNRLFSLDLADMSATLDIDHIESGEGEWYAGRAAQEMPQYTVALRRLTVLDKAGVSAANPAGVFHQPLDAEQRKRYLQLPDDVAPKTRRLVGDWLQQGGANLQARQIMNKALNFFSRGNFVYSTDDIRIDGDLVDGFIFGERKGYCEHYASAFVLMMRAAEIPARVVTGYAGADYRRDGDYFVVRQSFAHAWAEIWLPERGWTRVDPTAYVGDNAANDQDLLHGIKVFAQSITRVLAWLGELKNDWLLLGMLGVLVALLLLPRLGRIALALKLLPRAAAISPANALEVAAAKCFRQLLQRCRRHGLAVRDSDDIEACGAKICADRPDLLPTVKEFTHIYNNLRYSKNKAWTQLQRLQALLKRIKL